jgi:DNA-binding NtrC family response regulator
VQVKLLRVLQSRTCHRAGETQDRQFQGKIAAATNRDMAAEMQAGRFRPDLYYRLCSDVIETPSLAAQLQDAPKELGQLLHFLARRIAGEEEAGVLAGETEDWITKHLGSDYRWPGNVRELGQCVRNVMIRGEYHPPRPAARSARPQSSPARDRPADREGEDRSGASGRAHGRRGLEERSVTKLLSASRPRPSGAP